MIILKCSWRALLHLFCVVSWWIYHHDSCRSHSWCALFVKEPLRCFLASDSLCGFLLHRSHRDISRDLVTIPPRLERFPLTHDDWHGGSHPRVSSFSDGTSHRLCVAHSYICSVCSCDEHHTIIIFGGGARSSFFVEMVRYFVCKEVSVIIIVSFAMSGSVINTIPPGCEEDFCTRVWLTWGFLACEEVPAMISATCAQCGLVVHTYHNDTCRTFVPKSWLCFIYLDCVVQQSFALCSYCVVMWRTAHHRDRVALSKKLGNTWR